MYEMTVNMVAFALIEHVVIATLLTQKHNNNIWPRKHLVPEVPCVWVAML